MGEPAPAAPEQPRTLLPWDIKTRFRKKFRFQASRSYMLLCLGMGLVAAALPFLLIGIEGLQGADGQHPHYSISHFYYSVDPSGRDALVGSLCAVGVFLILFQGLSIWENRLLNLAGIAAIGVAFFPMDECQCVDRISAHYVFAITFFLCLAIVAIFFSKKRLEYIVWPPMKARLRAAYTVCGIAMIGLPLAVYLLHRLRPAANDPVMFWTESAGVWAFSAYWFVKTWEYRRLLGIRLR